MVREENPEYFKQWRKNNPEYSKQRYKNNPDKVRVNNQNRRARKNGNGGSHTPEEWQQLKDRYNHTCLSCRKQEPSIKLTMDHIIPISKGGTNFIDNIQPLCKSCNSSKRDKIIDYRK